MVAASAAAVEAEKRLAVMTESWPAEFVFAVTASELTVMGIEEEVETAEQVVFAVNFPAQVLVLGQMVHYVASVA